MKVEWLVTTTKPVDLNITEVTLLSEEEYRDTRDNIPAINGWWWWLRSPGYYQRYAAFVSTDGSLLDRYVNFGSGCVRPALRISDLKSTDLVVGDKFKLAEKVWTVISNDLALCDGSIGVCAFRKNYDSSTRDANSYEASDIKKFVDKWAMENKIIKPTQREWTVSTNIPSIKLVRCKDCGDYRDWGYCTRHNFDVKKNWYCADGYR